MIHSTQVFFKHDIYQKVHYLHNRVIYPLPTHLARTFEQLDELITRIIHAADKKIRIKITGRVKWSMQYNKTINLVELWVLLKNRYEKHCYSERQLTHIRRQFPYVTYDVN